jgi:cephalosporin-C deacetylase
MPLTFDFPFEQLADYNGMNPKPKDFDQFWESGLNEMKTVSPNIELIPSDFKTSFCECFDMYLAGVHGARIHSKLLRPIPAKSAQPAILMFHGYTGNSGNWFDKLGFAAQGFTVAAMDCRGQGGSSNDTGGVSGNTQNGHIIRGLNDALNGSPENLLFRQIFLDTAQLAGIIMDMPNVDANRVGVMGGSQGGALTIACAALEPRVKRAAPVYPFLSDYKRVWSMDQAKDAYLELQNFFRSFDPVHKNEEAIFEKLGYIDVQHLANRITAEVLWGIGLMDTICPPSSQFAAFNKIKSQKSMEIYPDYGHEELPGFIDKSFEFMMKL